MKKQMKESIMQHGQLSEILQKKMIIPIILIDDCKDAVPLAQALLRGGISTIEITLRTSIALDAITLIRHHVPQIRIGAGTILNGSQLIAAKHSGAHFVVSPGYSDSLIDQANKENIPFLPGVMTPGEIMAARDRNYHFLKFFPAEQAGGVPFLQSMASPFADVTFCPTGGITPKTAKDFLTLPNVACLGGSWIAPRPLIKTEQWDRITKLAQQAVSLSQEVQNL